MRRLFSGIILATGLALVLAACNERGVPTQSSLDDGGSLVTAKATKLPRITGGGITVNDNSGPPIELLNIGGFSARATDSGTVQKFVFPFTGHDITVYPARGQFQVKTALASGSNRPLVKGHGHVVCIANLGPAGAIDGQGQPGDVGDASEDVWEIRVGFPSPGGTLYGSFFVQDNGRDDFADESFGLPLTDECGTHPFFGLEPHVKGNITVHD